MRARGWRWMLGVMAIPALAGAQAQPAALPVCTGADPQAWDRCLGTWEDRAQDFFYAGEFRNGRPSGLGLMRTGSSLYAGEFLDGRVHGQGVLTFLGDRSKYVGQFREGAMHGRGAVVRADGSVVQSGQYEAGVLRQPDPPPWPRVPRRRLCPGSPARPPPPHPRPRRSPPPLARRRTARPPRLARERRSLPPPRPPASPSAASPCPTAARSRVT